MKIDRQTWNDSQKSDYIQLIRHRILNVDLAWVAQFLDIISSEAPPHQDGNLRIKDIGCQAFQFYKQIKKNKLPYSYIGYELDDEYIKIGLEFFPELLNNIYKGDFTLLDEIEITDISLCSATIEHVDNWNLFLEKMLLSTKSCVLIRSFFGENTERVCVRATGAKVDYPIWQFGFRDFLNAADRLGWKPEIKKDIFTQSLPQYLSFGKEHIGVVRTQFVIVLRPT